MTWDEDLWIRVLSEFVSHIDDGTVVLKNGRDELMLTPAGLFVPTQSMTFSEDQWCRLEEFGRQVVARLKAS